MTISSHPASVVTVIGLTGRMGSGKGEVALLLESSGFQPISLSDIVRQEAASAGAASSRKSLQDIGNLLRKKGGAGVLAARIREQIERSEEPRWVVDGIRNPTEIAELRKLPGFILWAIDTDIETIMARMAKRGRATDRLSREEILKRLQREWGENEDTLGQQVGLCMTMADAAIMNNGDRHNLRERVNNLLSQIGE